MKFLLVLAAAGFLSLINAPTMFAQVVVQPGQVGVALQPVSESESAPYANTEAPKITVADVNAQAHDRFMKRLWVASLVSAMAGTSLDAVSSWGQRESNGFLASADGRFEAKGVAIKAGFAAALMVPQICLRRHKDLKVAFAAGNFTQAAIFTGVSAYNFHVRSSN